MSGVHKDLGSFAPKEVSGSFDLVRKGVEAFKAERVGVIIDSTPVDNSAQGHKAFDAYSNVAERPFYPTTDLSYNPYTDHIRRKSRVELPAGPVNVHRHCDVD